MSKTKKEEAFTYYCTLKSTIANAQITADLYGLPRRQFLDYLQRQGAPVFREIISAKKPWSEMERQLALSLRRRGIPTKQIAQKLGRSDRAVQNMFFRWEQEQGFC